MLSPNFFILTATSMILVASMATQPFPSEGNAAKYPGDAGIERDPRVVFVEDFEEDSIHGTGGRRAV